MTPWSSRSFRLLTALCLALAPALAQADDPTDAPPVAAAAESEPSSAPGPPAATSNGQEAASPAILRSETASAPSTGSAGELEIFYVPDPQNPRRLAPVLGMELGQLRRAWAVMQGLAADAAAPPYSLNALTIEGTAQGGAAQLDAELSLHVDRDEWVRIPLRMAQASARTPPEHDGPGEFRSQFDPQQGWTVWLRGAAGSQHTVRWQLLVPLGDDAAGALFKLALPTAASSQLRLNIPGADLSVQLVGGSGHLQHRAPDAATTEVTLQGAHGDVELRWGPHAAAAAEAAPLDVQQWLSVELDRGRARLHNRLFVHRAVLPLAQFTVRLPTGARWSPVFPAGMKIREQPVGADGRTSLTIELDQPTTTAASVDILAEMPLGDADDEQSLELSAWETPGAATVSGFVALDGQQRWQLAVQRTKGLRPLDPGLLPLGFQRGDPSTAFAMLGEPFELQATVWARPAQVSVAPSYRLEVAADKAILRGSLTYSIRGPEPLPLRLTPNGWTVERFAPVGVEANPPAADAKEIVAPVANPAESLVMEVVARREMPADDAVSWTLPVPLGADVEPVQVAVAPAENIQWIAADEKQGDWVPMSAPDRTAGTASPREQLAWRSARPDAPLTAVVRVLPQEVSVTALSRVTLDQQSAQIEQLFDYHVRHEPLAELWLHAPAELAAQPALDCSLNGQPLDAAAWSVVPAAKPGESARLKFRLPAARTGQWQLNVAYRTPIEPLAADVTRRLDLPLFQPLQGDLEGNRLSVGGKSSVRVQADAAGPWKPTDDGRKGQNATALRLASATVQDRAGLLVTLDAHPTATTVIVERAWVQTNFLTDAGSIRAAYRIVTSEKRVTFSLPRAAVSNTLEVLLDGERTGYRVTAQGHVEIAWPEDANARPHLAELRAALSRELPKLAAAAVELPTVVGPTVVHRQYWQLLLPAQLHLLEDPPGWLAEQRWTWQTLGLGRASVLDQAQLEDWIGASHAAALPVRANAYLYSAFSGPGSARVMVASRTWLILFSSGAALTLGLGLLYWPRLRQPWALLLAGLALTAGCLLRPDAALIVGQAALAGAALALVAARLSGGVNSGAASTISAGPRGSSIVQRRGGQSSLPTVLRPTASPSAPATTHSVPIPVSMPDSKA